jgi:hypothetical protein
MPGARGRPHKREIYEGRLNNNVTARAARAARARSADSAGDLVPAINIRTRATTASDWLLGPSMRRRRGRTYTGQHQLAHVRSVVAESRETPPSCRVGTGHRARTWSTALRHRPSLQSCVFTRGVRPRVAPTNPTVRPRRAYWGPANESAEAGGRRAPAITAHFEEYDHSDEAKRDACFHEDGEVSRHLSKGVQTAAFRRIQSRSESPAFIR